MRRLNVIITGCSVLTLVTACAGAPQLASRHDPVTGQPKRHALVQSAAAGKHRTGRAMTSDGNGPRGSGLVIARPSCSSQQSGAEANGPLPCAPTLLIPVVLRHPRHGQPRTIYVRKPCLC